MKSDSSMRCLCRFLMCLTLACLMLFSAAALAGATNYDYSDQDWSKYTSNPFLIEKMEALCKKYPVGSHFNKTTNDTGCQCHAKHKAGTLDIGATGCTCITYDGASQCQGYAYYVFRNLFGVGLNTTGYGILSRTKTHSIQGVIALLDRSNAGFGSHLRINYGSGGVHSIIILRYDNEEIEYINCNLIGSSSDTTRCCRIAVNHETWASFAATYIGSVDKMLYVETPGIKSGSTTYDASLTLASATLNADNVSLNVGDSYTLTSTVSCNSKFTVQKRWVSSDTSVAAVSDSGVVTAVGSGTATITCYTSIGLDASCEVTVVGGNPKISLSVDRDIVIHGDRLGLSYSVTGGTAPYKISYRIYTIDGTAQLYVYSGTETSASQEYSALIAPSRFGSRLIITFSVEDAEGKTDTATAELKLIEDTHTEYEVIYNSGLRIRSGAGTSYTTLVVMPKGTHFFANMNLTEESSGYTWAYCTLEDGTKGWVAISDSFCVEVVHCQHESTIEDCYCGTETSQGYKHCTRCLDCGAEFDIWYSATASHNYEISLIEEATCTKDGKIYYECTRCSYVDDEVIPATGHTSEAVYGKVPTTTSTGYTDGTRCSVCKATLTGMKTLSRLSSGKQLILPAAVKKIGAYAYSGTAAETVVIGDKCTSIGSGAFMSSSSLRLVYIPASVTSISSNAFSSCPNVTLVVVEGSYGQTYAKNLSLTNGYITIK